MGRGRYQHEPQLFSFLTDVTAPFATQSTDDGRVVVDAAAWAVTSVPSPGTRRRGLTPPTLHSVARLQYSMEYSRYQAYALLPSPSEQKGGRVRYCWGTGTPHNIVAAG